MKTYPCEIICSNCKQPRTYEVPYGERKEDHLELKVCEKCGCNIIDPRIKEMKR